jgi:hypothetical protein
MKRIPPIGLIHARSGDKGNICNIGAIVSKPEYCPILFERVTAERVRQHFEGLCFRKAERVALPNRKAAEFSFTRRAGCGGTVTLRSDPQGKTYSTALLRMEIEVEL